MVSKTFFVILSLFFCTQTENVILFLGAGSGDGLLVYFFRLGTTKGHEELDFANFTVTLGLLLKVTSLAFAGSTL